MAKFGGDTERVGLLLATKASQSGRINGDARRIAREHRATLALSRPAIDTALHNLLHNSLLTVGEQFSKLRLPLVDEPINRQGGDGSKPSAPLVYRFDSERGMWDAPVEASEYLARRVAA